MPADPAMTSPHPAAASAAAPPTPFDDIGGEPAVRALVERFYDLMASEPAYAALRAMHDDELRPMRDSLTGFLTAWLGGPRHWLERRPGTCMMSLHRALDIGAQEASQWTGAMRQAMVDTAVPAALAARLDEAFSRMSSAMRRR